jgi:hypothetical protein
MTASKAHGLGTNSTRTIALLIEALPVVAGVRDPDTWSDLAACCGP